MTDCIESVGCLQGGCTPGSCSNPQWEARGYAELLGHVATSLHPDTIILFNSGIWPGSGFTSPVRIRGLLDLATPLRERGVQERVWKTSTRTEVSLNNTNAVDEYGWPLQPGRPERDTLLPAIAAEMPGAGWRLFDAYGLTSSLHNSGLPLSRFYLDRVHFTPDVYRGLNEALLLDLTHSCAC